MEEIEYATWDTGAHAVDTMQASPHLTPTVSGGLDQDYLEALQYPPHLQSAVNQARNQTLQMQPVQAPEMPTPNATHNAAPPTPVGPTNFAKLTPEQNMKLLELHYAPSDAKFVETQPMRDTLAIVALVSFIILGVLLVYYMVVQSRINKLDASVGTK